MYQDSASLRTSSNKFVIENYLHQFEHVDGGLQCGVLTNNFCEIFCSCALWLKHKSCRNLAMSLSSEQHPKKMKYCQRLNNITWRDMKRSSSSKIYLHGTWPAFEHHHHCHNQPTSNIEYFDIIINHHCQNPNFYAVFWRPVLHPRN